MAMTVRYLTIDGEIVSETRSGVRSDYIPDPLGSTAALINSSHTITDTFLWWPFGEQRSHVGSGVTPFGYGGTLGYYTSKIANWLYVQARVFRPGTTCWQTVDPHWPSEAAFLYVRARPITVADPSGLGCVSCFDGIDSEWAHLAPQHLCRPGYSHCMACCVLAANFGVDCAIVAQGLQIGMSPKRWPGWVERATECAVGIGGGLGTGSDILSACNARCAATYGRPADPKKAKECGPGSPGMKPYPSIPCGCPGGHCRPQPNYPRPGPPPRQGEPGTVWKSPAGSPMCG